MFAPKAHYSEADFSGYNVSLLEKSIPEEGSIEGIHHVAEILRELQSVLAGAGLQAEFNLVYRYLSQIVAEAYDAGLFDDTPTDLNKTSGYFLDMYLEALRRYVEAHGGDDNALGRMILPWQQALLDKRVRRGPKGLKVATGITAHITADLGLSLHKAEVSREYYHGYTNVVNQLIDQATRDLITDHPDLISGHRFIKEMARRKIIGQIAVMRETAWDDSVSFRAAETDFERDIILNTAIRRAALQNEIAITLGRPALLAASVTELFPGGSGRLWVPPEIKKDAS